jgi:hypothetical protein
VLNAELIDAVIGVAGSRDEADSGRELAEAPAKHWRPERIS